MFLQKLFNHFKSKTYASTVNKPIRMGRSFGKKAIFAGNIPQSGGEFIYQWDAVMTHIKEENYVLNNCLMLGVAGGTAISPLRKYYPKIQILGIEIDPVILDIAQQNTLFKTHKNTKIKIADAVEWIKLDRNKYDLIMVDLYLGVLNPPTARVDSFLRDVMNHLTPKGIVLYNCHYRQSKRGEHSEFIKRVKKLYTRVEVIFEFPKNKVLLLEK